MHTLRAVIDQLLVFNSVFLWDLTRSVNPFVPETVTMAPISTGVLPFMTCARHNSPFIIM